MDSFLELNRTKLKFAFFATSLSLLTLACIFLAIGYSTNHSPSTELEYIILIFAGVVFPVFLLFLAYLGWLYKHSVKRKQFSKTPFDQLENIGFYKSYINAENKWLFTEEVREAKFNGFTVLCDVSKQNSRVIEFKAQT